MTAIRPERLGADRVGPKKSGPEKYAPDRANADDPGDSDQTAAVEGEIREFVRRDVAYLRKTRPETEPAPGANGDAVTENLNSLIRRVSGASMEEIDHVILELQSIRDMLRDEGERVNREIAGYASLSHAAMTAMKVIAGSLKQWKEGAPPEPARRSAN